MWTITPYWGASSDNIYTVSYEGQFGSTGVSMTYAVRPVITLSSSVESSGSGTVSDPYKIVGDNAS